MDDEEIRYSKISIITVSYNAVKTIEQTIQSVVNQTYTNIEYIIIDGGSTDGTVDIIRKYADKITYWMSESDKGIYDAMNKGIDIVTGEWIYFIGADDCLVNEGIMHKIACYLNDDIDILSGYVWIINEESKNQYLYKNNYNKTVEEDFLSGNIKAHHQGMLTRTTVTKNIYFDIKYQIGADFKLLLQLWTSNNLSIKKIDVPIAFFSDSGMGSVLYARRKEEHSTILKEMGFDKNLKSKFLEDDFFTEIKEFIKLILKKLGLMKLIRKRNFVQHKCKWSICRWCK